MRQGSTRARSVQLRIKNWAGAGIILIFPGAVQFFNQAGWSDLQVEKTFSCLNPLLCWVGSDEIYLRNKPEMKFRMFNFDIYFIHKNQRNTRWLQPKTPPQPFSLPTHLWQGHPEVLQQGVRMALHVASISLIPGSTQCVPYPFPRVGCEFFAQ